MAPAAVAAAAAEGLVCTGRALDGDRDRWVVLLDMVVVAVAVSTYV